MIIWIIGLSGSGKTTIGREVYRQWRTVEPNTVLLDGDQLRCVFAHENRQTDYSLTGREVNSRRAQGLCQLLDEQGINVVCCLLSLFEAHRQENRKQLSRYFEVFVDVPFQTLVARDDKGLYQPALDGETNQVVGVDIPFTAPEQPDMVVKNSLKQQDISRYAEQILTASGVLR